MAKEFQISSDVTLLQLSRAEKLHLITRLAAQLAEEDILFGDGQLAISHNCILQIPIEAENRSYKLRIE